MGWVNEYFDLIIYAICLWYQHNLSQIGKFCNPWSAKFQTDWPMYEKNSETQYVSLWFQLRWQ